MAKNRWRAPTLGIMVKYQRKIPQWSRTFRRFLQKQLKPAYDLQPESRPAICEVLSGCIESGFHLQGHSMTLDTTPLGSTVRIISLESSDIVTLRLMEMGLVPGSAVRVVKFAPLGDPIQICIRNNYLALRRNEARTITVCSD